MAPMPTPSTAPIGHWVLNHLTNSAVYDDGTISCKRALNGMQSSVYSGVYCHYIVNMSIGIYIKIKTHFKIPGNIVERSNHMHIEHIYRNIRMGYLQ